MTDCKNIIFRFPEGNFKALIMSYDDGALHDRRLVEIFNRHKIRGTFHLNSTRFGDGYSVTAEEIPELYRGHEVSAHTATHPPIGIMPLGAVAREITDDRQALEDACGYTVRGMSYPYGMVTDEILAALPSCGIEYSRTVNSTGKFDLPENFLLWNPSCHHSEALPLADSFVENNKSWILSLLFVWGHSYEFDRNNNWELIESFCEKTGNRDDIWYVTAIEFVDYINALHSLKFTVRGDRVYNPTATDVWLDVDGKTVKIGGGTTAAL